MAYQSKTLSKSIATPERDQANSQGATAQFADNRISTATQLKQQTLMTASPTATAQRAAVNTMNTSAVQQQKIIQRAAPEEELQMKSIHSTTQLAGMDEEELLQGKFETTQRVEDEELLQGKFETAQRAEDEELLQGKFEPAQRAEKPNNTGLPDNLKSGIENLSGMSMDHVKVHYNSDKPAQLQAHAYAQGSEIHVAPGQEQHLPHEAWHVVQQAQGRVKPTVQMKGGVPVNDDAGLEAEADLMGTRVLQMKQGEIFEREIERDGMIGSSSQPIQRVVYKWISKAGRWISIQELEKPGTYPLPLDGAGGEFFNNVDGKQGAKQDDVFIKPSPWGDNTPLFEDLMRTIDEDDRSEHSQIDISWKHEVIRNRRNQAELDRLSKNITQAKTGPNIPPQFPSFDHGEIGELDISHPLAKARLGTEANLLSGDRDVATAAVSTVRGNDESYSPFQGAILRQFIAEERAAILGLVAASSDASVVFSLERGGSMIADLMERIAGTPEHGNRKISKPTKADVAAYIEQVPAVEAHTREEMLNNPAHQKQVHVEMFKAAIRQYIADRPPGEITIAIAETAVGGGSVNSMRKIVGELSDELSGIKGKKLTFKILVARETIKNTNYRGSGVVKLQDPAHLQDRREGVKSGLVMATNNPHEVEMYFSQTKYLLGEDVDYQLQYSGATSGYPVVVFEGSGEDITAMSITPAGGSDSARQIILDLVAGAYDNLMDEIFRR